MYTAHDTLGKTILRFGLALVFFYFGFSQLHNPGQWIGFLPHWLASAHAMQVKFVLVNGSFEIIAAAMLVLGAYTRIVAVLLALHLFGIAFTIGFNPIGMRDVGLAISTLALAAMGAGMTSIDFAAHKVTDPVVR